jgi:hypothetical protein
MLVKQRRLSLDRVAVDNSQLRDRLQFRLDLDHAAVQLVALGHANSLHEWEVRRL